MTGLARFERATYRLGGGCSIQLSYSPKLVYLNIQPILLSTSMASVNSVKWRKNGQFSTHRGTYFHPCLSILR